MWVEFVVGSLLTMIKYTFLEELPFAVFFAKIIFSVISSSGKAFESHTRGNFSIILIPNGRSEPSKIFFEKLCFKACRAALMNGSSGLS